jgi:protein gp37
MSLTSLCGGVSRGKFVNSMSDLFHHDVPLDFIRHVFDVAGKADWQTFQILTKRSERLVELAKKLPWHANIWMGVSIENQDYVYRTEHLRRVPAAVRFLSVEPLLGAIPRLPLQGIHWVIVGGESGPGARAIDPAWVRKIRDRCIAQAVPFFFKQRGGTRKKSTGRELDGRTWDEMPESESNRPKRVLA